METAVIDEVLAAVLAEEGMLRFLDNLTVKSCSQKQGYAAKPCSQMDHRA